MSLGRRPREVYRACSEDDLLQGAEPVEDDTLEHLAADPPVTRLAAGRVMSAAGTPARHRTARSIAVTLMATLAGLAVGLGVVTLIERVGGSHTVPSPSGVAAQAAPPAAFVPPARWSERPTVARERRPAHDTATAARARALGVRRDAGEGAAAETYVASPPSAAPGWVPPAAAAAPRAGREPATEFGFER